MGAREGVVLFFFFFFFLKSAKMFFLIFCTFTIHNTVVHGIFIRNNHAYSGLEKKYNQHKFKNISDFQTNVFGV